VPDDGELVDFMGDITSETERKALLVDNPARLYGF
jgi:predicted TIM-barrel fold metal-dependent hydrolase